jgi:hypothetical protein
MSNEELQVEDERLGNVTDEKSVGPAVVDVGGHRLHHPSVDVIKLFFLRQRRWHKFSLRAQGKPVLSGLIWPNVIKLFCPDFTNFRNKKAFVPDKLFQSSLTNTRGHSHKTFLA